MKLSKAQVKAIESAMFIQTQKDIIRIITVISTTR